MKKLNKKVVAILGTVALALGVFAIPAFANTIQPPMGTAGNMQSFMSTDIMQNMYNSQVMQAAMTNSNITSMINAMNTPEMKQIMGDQYINQMIDYMNNGNFQAMYGQGGMMGTTGNMMGGFISQR